MKQRRRIYYSAAQRAEIWDRWQRGESMNEIGRFFDRAHSSISNILNETGGVRKRLPACSAHGSSGSTQKQSLLSEMMCIRHRSEGG